MEKMQEILALAHLLTARRQEIEAGNVVDFAEGMAIINALIEAHSGHEQS